MPCSAEIEPPARGDEVVDEARDRRALALVPVGRGAAAGADVEMDVAVAEMAEAAGDDAGERALDLGRGVDEEARHVGDRAPKCRAPASGPSARSASEMLSRMLPEGLGLRFVGGDRPRRRRAPAQAPRRAAARARPRRRAPRSAVVASTSTCHAMRCRRAARACPGMCFSTSSSESCGTSSNPSTLLVRASRKRSSVERRAPGCRRPPRRPRAPRSPAPAAARRR